MSRVRTLPIQTASAAYNVLLGEDLLTDLPQYLGDIFGQRPRRYFVVTSPEIWALWSEVFLSGFAAYGGPTVLLLPQASTTSG
jgi:3-dehydroquinate synthase